MLVVHSLVAWPWASRRILPALRFIIKEIRGDIKGCGILKEPLWFLWFSKPTLSSQLAPSSPPPGLLLMGPELASEKTLLPAFVALPPLP